MGETRSGRCAWYDRQSDKLGDTQRHAHGLLVFVHRLGQFPAFIPIRIRLEEAFQLVLRVLEMSERVLETGDLWKRTGQSLLVSYILLEQASEREIGEGTGRGDARA